MDRKVDKMSGITILIITAALVAFGVGEVNGQAWLENHEAAKHAND